VGKKLQTRRIDMKEKITEKLKPQIEARDKAQEKVDRLQKAMASYEEKADGLKGKIRDLNKKIAEDLGEGKDVAKKQTNLRTLRQEMGEAQDLAEQINQESLPEALQKLKQAKGDLTVMLEAVLVEFRKDFEKRMNDHLDALMEIFDSWNLLTKELFGELKIGLVSGSVSQIPKLINPRFYRYITATGLGLEEKPVLTGAEEEEAAPGIEAEVIEESQEAVEQ